MSFLLGVLFGVLLTAIAIWQIALKVLVKVEQSKEGLEEIVLGIEKTALAKGWKVPHIYDIQKTLQGSGYDKMTPLKILSLCQPDHAYSLLSSDTEKFVSAMMPCRVAVYGKKDGKTYLAYLNMALMSKLFGGRIAKVMSDVTAEQAEILSAFVE